MSRASGFVKVSGGSDTRAGGGRDGGEGRGAGQPVLFSWWGLKFSQGAVFGGGVGRGGEGVI